MVYETLIENVYTIISVFEIQLYKYHVNVNFTDIKNFLYSLNLKETFQMEMAGD